MRSGMIAIMTHVTQMMNQMMTPITPIMSQATRQALSLVLGLIAMSSPVRADYQMSAGMREYFFTPKEYSFGYYTTARVKYALQNLGFNSLTATVRLGLRSPTDSYVYSPSQRANVQDLRYLASRMSQANEGLILKPIIMKPYQDDRSGSGVAERMTGIRPKDARLFFSSYRQQLYVLASLGNSYDVRELVLGVGMQSLWGPEHGRRWLDLARFVRDDVQRGLLAERQQDNMGGRQRRSNLSIEITSFEDLDALESWSRASGVGQGVCATGGANCGPESWKDFVTYLDRVRIAGSDLGFVLKAFPRLLALFPKSEFVLSNITIPACAQPVWDEDEVSCPDGNFGIAEDASVIQAEHLKQWLAAFKQFPLEYLGRITQLELRAATTEQSPELGKEDRRFLLYSPKIKEAIGEVREYLKGEFSQKGIEFRAPLEEINSEGNRDLPPLVDLSPEGLLAQDREALGPQKTRVKHHARAKQGHRSRLVKFPRVACIYYDRLNLPDRPPDRIGALHAPMIQSVLGAFRNWSVRKKETLQYQRGELSACGAVLVVGSNFLLNPPEGFYDELVDYSQKRPVVWMNYKIGQLIQAYDAKALVNKTPALGFKFVKLEQGLGVPTRDKPDVGSFKTMYYKGKDFEKVARWNHQLNSYAGSMEMNIVEVTDRERVEVLSETKHSVQDRKTPYIVHAKTNPKIPRAGIWYTADLPFAYVDYGTPYFIFCDILWDILGETPPPGPKVALVRLEDVRPSLPPDELVWAVDFLASRKVPFSMAVIPYYSHVIWESSLSRHVGLKPGYLYPRFTGMLQHAVQNGGSIVFHGVEHAAGDLISGFDGDSGADYEFWMYPSNTPHPKDSVDYVMDKLERGEDAFRKMGFKPRVWESPHYAASALDYWIFGKLFEWNYHRSIYFDVDIEEVAIPKDFRIFEKPEPKGLLARRALLKQVKITGDQNQFAGQIIPYPVYRDSYGQAVIPETLGFVDYPFYTENPLVRVSHVEDLLKQADRLTVVRGAMASFFWHVDLVAPSLSYYFNHPGHYEKEGGRNTLIRMVEGLQKLGYEFKSVEDRSVFPDL